MRDPPSRTFISKEHESAMTEGQRRTREYFTLAARNVSVRKAYPMVMSPRETCSSDLRVDCPGTSRRSHTHGSNRNRIALHVALSGRRNCIL